jgi:hypothetical protein
MVHPDARESRRGLGVTGVMILALAAGAFNFQEFR